MSWPGQASEHEADHGETDEGRHGSRITLEIAGEPSVAADPSEGSLDNPSLGQDDETMGIAALDDLQVPEAGLGDEFGHFRPLIAGVDEDLSYEGKAAPRLLQHSPGAVAILNIGGQDAHAEQEPERVDKNMPLAPGDFLARVKPLRINRCAPF